MARDARSKTILGRLRVAWRLLCASGVSDAQHVIPFRHEHPTSSRTVQIAGGQAMRPATCDSFGSNWHNTIAVSKSVELTRWILADITASCQVNGASRVFEGAAPQKREDRIRGAGTARGVAQTSRMCRDVQACAARKDRWRRQLGDLWDRASVESGNNNGVFGRIGEYDLDGDRQWGRTPRA